MQAKKPPCFIKTSKDKHHFLTSNSTKKTPTKPMASKQEPSLNLAMSNDAGSRYLERWISFESHLRNGKPKEKSVVQESREEKSSSGSVNETLMPLQKCQVSVVEEDECSKGSSVSRSLSFGVSSGKATSKTKINGEKQNFSKIILIVPPEERKQLEEVIKNQKETQKKEKGLYFVSQGTGKPPKSKGTSGSKGDKSSMNRSKNPLKSKPGKSKSGKSKNASKNSGSRLEKSRKEPKNEKENERSVSRAERFLLKCVHRKLISNDDFDFLMAEYVDPQNPDSVSKELLAKLKSLSELQRAKNAILQGSESQRGSGNKQSSCKPKKDLGLNLLKDSGSKDLREKTMNILDDE